MGRIVHVASGKPVRINRRTLFGRAVTGVTHLGSNSSSKEHACIDWDGQGWLIRDLGSRNGTRINGSALADREWRLSVGDRLAFGDAAELWEWTDDGPPCPFALDANGKEIFGSQTLLALPDDGSPSATVYALEDAWELDEGHSQRLVKHDELVTVGGQVFRLQLPETSSDMIRTRTNQLRPRLGSGHAAFRVSPDEEHVEVQIGVAESALHALPRRAFGYMLLTLGRQRQGDQEAGLPREEAGWVHADDFAARLGTTLEKLNVDIHRLRHVVAKLGLFEDPNGIVERRTGQLRIGIGELRITRSTGRFEASAEGTETAQTTQPVGIDSKKDSSKRLA